MAEKSFDALLYQALLEAGWQENRTAWEGTEEPAFSPQYLRWRTRLLADPFGWGKKQLRPLWAKALRTAACAHREKPGPGHLRGGPYRARTAGGRL